MKFFRYIYLLIFLWFPKDVKASLSINSDLVGTYSFVKKIFFSKALKGVILFPFEFKIKLLTFYSFDLVLNQVNFIKPGRRQAEKESVLSTRDFLDFPLTYYKCKNEYTSFIPLFRFFISKRKKIKKIFERVDLCFDSSLHLLSFYVVLLTKDGKNLKFFHSPEAEEKFKKGRPFGFSFPLKKVRLQLLEELKKEGKLGNVDKFFSFLYCAASCFRFCFDNIMICPYLFCCIEFPIKAVLYLFFIFIKYLFLKKGDVELKEPISGNVNNEKDDENKKMEGGENFKSKSLWSVIKQNCSVNTLLRMFKFSIKIF